MKITIAAVVFSTLLMSINAYPHAITYQVAKVASHVGSHGPALINLHWPNTWPGSDWGNGLGGSAGHSGSSGQTGSGEGYGGSWGNGGSVGYSGDGGYHDGKYVAINRGVKSQNYQPAPGTTW